jgi:hypothetical protein
MCILICNLVKGVSFILKKIRAHHIHGLKPWILDKFKEYFTFKLPNHVPCITKMINTLIRYNYFSTLIVNNFFHIPTNMKQNHNEHLTKHTYYIINIYPKCDTSETFYLKNLIHNN